jgi:hypothetical protein
MDHMNAEIAAGGKEIIYCSSDGQVRWRRGSPTAEEWQRLALYPQTDINLVSGRFQYVQHEGYGEIIAVFTPSRGLDFNLTYDVNSGELKKIHEAR